MVESLVITLREGIEAALVVGIILAYLRKTGKLSLARSVYTGLVLAIVASAGAAIMFQALNVDPENELFEGILFGVAGILVASMVVWMWRTAKNIKGEMESKLSTIVPDAGNRKTGSVGLFLFTFVMVFREGVETALFLFAATLGEFDLLSASGALLGLALAALFAVLLIKGSVRINLARFFSVTSFVLLLLALRLLAGSVHEFSEIGVLPMSKQIMAFIGFFVRDSSTTLIMVALLAAPVLMILWDTLASKQNRAPVEAATLTGADRRKLAAVARRDRVWRFGLVAGALVVISAMASTAFAGGKPIDPAPVSVSPVGDAIHIPLVNLPEGQLQKFSYHAGSVDVRFIAMRHADGSVHAGFDACQICGGAGYMQDGEHAVCKNCNAPILTSTIGEAGGCNPLPLPSQVTGGELVVPVSGLSAQQASFTK